VAFQRIGSSVYFSIVLCREHEMFNDANSQDGKLDLELMDLIFRIESCEEVSEVFDNLYVCPFCFEKSVDGVIVHKSREDAKQ
jgi:hypothetical protein